MELGTDEGHLPLHGHGVRFPSAHSGCSTVLCTAVPLLHVHELYQAIMKWTPGCCSQARQCAAVIVRRAPKPAERGACLAGGAQTPASHFTGGISGTDRSMPSRKVGSNMQSSGGGRS